MVNVRIFEISDEIFGGFSCQIDLDFVNTLDEICNEILIRLRGIINQYNLFHLNTLLEKKKFHIHGYSFADILISDSHKIFYICCHC